jgi:hypothetical protein
VSKRVIYVPKKQRERREREALKAVEPVVKAAMDKAALGRALAGAKKLIDAERQQDEDVLTAARNVFPELRRRSRVLPPVASATVAEEGEVSSPTPSPPAAHRAGWYRRRGGRTVKDVAPAGTPWWPTDSDVPVPAPFPAGLEVK